VPYRDPTTAVLENPEVPESRRYCSRCHREVGRARDGRPGRLEGFCRACGHPFSFTPKLAPGEVLRGQYEVLGCLAHGGLGWVYLAADRAVSDRWVVLKGLLDSGDADAMRAALAERRFLAEVEHPNIVKIHNFVQHEDRRTGEPTDYIVMEYVGGRSLKELLKERRSGGVGTESLPLAQAIAYVLEVLPALGYLHGVGLLYCDFKPDNVIQTEEQLKLIDLGAVRHVDDRHSAIFGTGGYQAPEVRHIGASVASDLYTVGRTLAVMSFPFDFRHTYRDRLPGPEEQPLLLRFNSYYRFLKRATHADPDQRFSSAEEMAEQLTGVLREVLAASDGVPRPGLSKQFTPERRTFGVEGSRSRVAMTFRSVAEALPVPQVDTEDPAAGFLATAASARPQEVVSALRAAPQSTVEVRFRLTHALIELGETEAALRELHRMTATAMFAGSGPPLVEPDDWRPHWYWGLTQLAAGRPADAGQAFDVVCDAVPGEAAPKLALAVCAEATHDDIAAADRYELVWRTDHAYVSAAFGLARVLMQQGARTRAVAVLDSVPETSSHHVAAQTAAVRAQSAAMPKTPLTERDLLAAGARLERLDVDVELRARLTAEVLLSALEWVRAGGRSSEKLLGGGFEERELRLGVEKAYRVLARLADTPEERIALVDRANAIRPRTVL
jgi:serine/threonine-protein kinase PknG